MTGTKQGNKSDAAGSEACCLHCGLPVPAGSRNKDFCCPGCEAVYGLLHDCELERFYELGGAEGRPIGAAPKAGPREWLIELEDAAATPDGRVRLRLDVQGIHCAACVWLLQELWDRREGSYDIEINPSLGRVVLSYDRNELEVADYLNEIEGLGYRFAPPSAQKTSRNRGSILRLGICAALSMNVMAYSTAFYFGLQKAESGLHELFRWVAFAICTIAVLVGAPPFFQAALAGLRRRVLHLDLPVALGITLAWSGSLVAFVSGGGHSYFDTVTIFVTLMLAGRFIQERAIAKNRDYLLANDGAAHLRARRIVEGVMERIHVTEVRTGDMLWVVPGDLVSADAVLFDEAASFSLEWINGESDAREFEPGDTVPAGAFLSGSRPARLQAVKGPEESGLLELLQTESAEVKNSALSGFWSKVNRVYVALVLSLAATGALIWAFIDPSRVITVAVSILVVTCPCALGIAIPLAFELALARLRSMGIYLRDAQLLEKALHWKKVFFDKTGTLTWGGLRATACRPVEGRERDILFTMTQSSGHPVSEAIAEDLDGARLIADLPVEEEVGKGLSASFEGREYRLGRPAFSGTEGAGRYRHTHFSVDGELLASFELEEDFRPGYVEEIAALEDAGIEVHLLSGDTLEKVHQAAEKLGLDQERALGALTPDEKADYVKRLDQGGGLMVGDGLNDAPAFKVATSTATPAIDRPVLPSQADFFYAGGGAPAVRLVLATSQRLRRVVKRNLMLAGLYNLVVLSWCFAGLMTPVLCAILMPMSSVLLILHTMVGIKRSGGAEIAR